MPKASGEQRTWLSRVPVSVQKWLREHKNGALLGLLWVITAGVFVLDMLLPWGIAIWLLYVFPLLLTFWLPYKKNYVVIPAVMSILIVTAFFTTAKQSVGFPLETTAFNRAMGIGVLWITKILIRVRKRLDENLHDTIRELNRSNQDLEQLAYVASHDLQEPLRMVASFSELLARRYRDRLDQDALEFIGFIVDGAHRMQQLINDLLALSRVGRADLSQGWVDCNQMVDRIVRGLKLDPSGPRVEHGPLPRVWGNENGLAQVFQNLIDNGLKFHGERPQAVTVRAEPQSAEWLFAVQDNGIGIEPQYWDQIFLLFQRLNSREKFAGTGIGLTICKKIVELHGGRIWVQSQPGEGSVFFFTLPQKGGHAA